MKKGMNKSGAEFGVIFGIVLGVLVLLLAGWFAWNTFSSPTAVVKNLPDTAGAAVLVCNSLDSTAGYGDGAYCTQLRETKNSDLRVTCGYLAEQSLLAVNKSCTDANGNTMNSVELAKATLCKKAFTIDGIKNEKLNVNGVLCSEEVTCADVGGQYKANCESGEKAMKGFKDQDPAGAAISTCCVPSTA